MSECKCTFAQRLTGDGCEACNPDMAIKLLKDNFAELEAINRELYEALKALYEASDCIPPGKCVDDAEQAINKAEGKS